MNRTTKLIRMIRNFMSLGIIAAIASPLFAQTSPVVARIANIEVTAADLKKAVANSDLNLAKDPAVLNQYARNLLVQKLLLKQSLEEKWDQKPEVAAELARAREMALTESYLAAKAVLPKGFPSEAEIAKAYEANKGKLQIPSAFLLGQIFIGSPEGADAKETAAAKARLDNVAKRLAAKGADFAAIATDSSEDRTSAANGGRIGWFSEAKIQREIRDKIPKLAPGVRSEPFKLKDGWHIIKVMEQREARTPTLAEISDGLAARLREERSKLMRQQFIVDLLKENPPAINEIELGKILAKP